MSSMYPHTKEYYYANILIFNSCLAHDVRMILGIGIEYGYGTGFVNSFSTSSTEGEQSMELQLKLLPNLGCLFSQFSLTNIIFLVGYKYCVFFCSPLDDSQQSCRHALFSASLYHSACKQVSHITV